MQRRVLLITTTIESHIILKSATAGSVWTSFLLLQRIGVDPDLRKTDGGMEAEEDDEWDAHVPDYAPRTAAVEVRVDGNILRLLHLKDADDPQRQIAQQQKDDDRPSGLLFGLDPIPRPSLQCVRYEDGLKGRLCDVEDRASKGQDGHRLTEADAGKGRHQVEALKAEDSAQRDEQKRRIEFRFGFIAEEAQALELEESDDDPDEDKEEEEDLSGEEEDARRVGAVE